MSLSSSAHCTFSAHFLFPDYSFSRHCIVSQALQPLPSLSLSQQHSSTENSILASRLHPFVLSGAQPAASSSYSSSPEDSYGRRARYINASRDTEMSDQALPSKKEMELSRGEKGAASSSANEDMAANLSTLSQENAEKHAEDDSARSISSFETTDTYPSDAKEAMNASISQVGEEEASFDREPSMPVNRPADEFKRLPINLDLELYRAKCLFRNREFEKAEKILRQCIKDWPTDGRAYVALGTRLVKQGKFVDARTVYEDGCQAARGENPYIWQAWAMLEQKLGHISQARKLFDASTAADVKHAAAWHGWAVLELQQGSTKKARELLSKGIKFCGGNEYLFQTSALIQYRAGKVEEARALFSQAVHFNPRSCASWLAWALLESEKGNVSTARYLFQRGIRASPKNRYSWQAWALFESSQGKKSWARRLFEQGVELNPYDAVLLQAFALFEYDSSNPVKARELFELAASIDPKHQPVWNAWGWMEWKEGNLALARQYYRKSLSVNSRTVDAARTFHAWAILEEGAENYAAARELFKCTLRVDPQNAPAWTSWARLEEDTGNGVRAEEIRMQYLQQRTEVVEEAAWDVSFSSMFAPAINRIKEFFKIQIPASTDDEKPTGLMPEIMEVLNRRRLDMDKVKCDDDFDLEAFINEVLPWKSMSESRTLRQKPKSLRITTVAS
eukprot:c22455_g1_i1 orf=391-2427(+)